MILLSFVEALAPVLGHSHLPAFQSSLCLIGGESLFQQATRKFAGLAASDVDVSASLTVSNEERRFLASE